MILTTKSKDQLDYIEIQDYYNLETLDNIKKELSKLNDLHIFKDNLNHVKRKSVFLKDYYKNRLASTIWKHERLMLCEAEYEKIKDSYYIYKHLKQIAMQGNIHTLVNLFTNEDYYKSHVDNSVLSLVIFVELGNIKGGDVYLPEFNETIPFKDNCGYLIQGCVNHEVLKTYTENGARASIVSFFNYN